MNPRTETIHRVLSRFDKPASRHAESESYVADVDVSKSGNKCGHLPVLHAMLGDDICYSLHIQTNPRPA